MAFIQPLGKMLTDGKNFAYRRQFTSVAFLHDAAKHRQFRYSSWFIGSRACGSCVYFPKLPMSACRFALASDYTIRNHCPDYWPPPPRYWVYGERLRHSGSALANSKTLMPPRLPRRVRHFATPLRQWPTGDLGRRAGANASRGRGSALSGTVYSPIMANVTRILDALS